MRCAPAETPPRAAPRLAPAAWFALAIPAIALFSPSASAQVSGSLAVENQALLRGQPASDGRPVAVLSLAYDLPGGGYLGGSAAAVATSQSGLQPQAVVVFAGFVRPIGDDLSLDLGIVHSRYSEYSGLEGSESYTEAYAGLVERNLSARMSFSPDYLRTHNATLYAELSGSIDLSRNWSAFAHAGLLARLSHDSPEPGMTADWRVGIRRQVGVADLSVAWAGYSGSGDTYGPGRGDRSAVLLGLSIGI